MGKKVKEYNSGDFIFAKVKGYPAWPARVQKQNGKKYFVYFYGTGETANLPPNMIFDYAENKDKFLNKSVKRKDFNDGVKQIEYDFANNIPLEEVVGVAAEPGPADATLNDSANDTADDSAIADTTADETIDESAANSTANDVPVEDSDDAGALVIDEGKQKGRKSAKPATPKAKEPKTPRGRSKKEESKPEGEEEEIKKEEEIVSRSGRKIRPKRYMDEQTEENTTLPSPAPKKRRGASPEEKEKEKPVKEKKDDKNIRAYNTVQQSQLRELKEPFHSANADKENILITYLPSGEYCGIKLFTGRPTNFKSDAARYQWDKQAASNAITLKGQLEKGQITPESISAQLVMDLNLTDEEKGNLDNDRELEMKKARLHFLRTEMKLIELDAKIKTCISLEKADTEMCLKLIDEILELDISSLMLLKHPTCMETVKRMRVYVGNTPSWAMTEAEALAFSKQAHHIRSKADTLFTAWKDLFDVPEGLSFWEFFQERVSQFKAHTTNMPANVLLEMFHEPIEMSQPTSHTMKAAIEAANEEESPEAEPSPKKKATPAKGKKSSNTPAKSSKRQSSRKQEDKEKDKEKEPEKEQEVEKENETEKEMEGVQEEPEPETSQVNNTEKELSEPKENNANEANGEKEDEPEKEKEDDIYLDKEVEKVNENAENKDESPEAAKTSEVENNDSEKTNDVDTPKTQNNDTEAISNDKGDNEEESNSENKGSGEKEIPKDSTKEEKSSVNDKKEKPKKDDKVKEDVKNGKDKAKTGEKRKEEKSEEKEKDADEPRAKRSREIKKTEPPPRSPAKRKSKF